MASGSVTGDHISGGPRSSAQLRIMAIRVVEFSGGGYKVRKIFAKESTYPKEISNFEFWINGELSKIGHHFSNKVI